MGQARTYAQAQMPASSLISRPMFKQIPRSESAASPPRVQAGREAEEEGKETNKAVAILAQAEGPHAGGPRVEPVGKSKGREHFRGGNCGGGLNNTEFLQNKNR